MSDAVVVGLIAGIPPTLVALAALIQALYAARQQSALHRQINSRMTQLIRTTNKNARAEGVEEGEAQPRKRPPRKRG